MALQGGTVRWVIEADDSGFNEAVDSAQAKAKQLKTTFEQSTPSKGGLFGNFTNSVLGAKDSLLGLGKSLANIGWGTFSAGATAATGALTSLIAKGISGTDFLETARTSMAGLTGSLEAGNTALSKAAKFWQNNPFDRFTTTNATKQLIQFGRSLNQIDDDLNLLGDISLSTGINLDELARYFARTAASGRAMTMDIEMMSDRGIPIYQKLSEVTGKTTSAIRDMASKGQISFEIFEQAMKKAVNPEAMEEFNNTLARQKDRFSGSISNLAGDLAGYKIVNDQLVISANGLEKAWTRLLKTLSTELRGEKLRTSMEKLGKSFAQIVDRIEPLIPLLVDKLGTALEFIANHSSSLIPILGGVLAVFGKFGQSIPGIGGIIGAVGNSFNGLTKSIVGLVSKNPLLAGFIAIFGTGFVSAIKNSESFRQSIGELFNALGNLFQALLPVAQTFIKIFVQIASSKAVIGILQSIVKVLTVLANVISIIPTDILTGLVTSLLMFKLISVSPMTALAGGIMLVVGALSSFIEEAGGLQSVITWFGQVFTNIGNSFKNFGIAIGQATSGIFQAIAKPFNRVLIFLKEIPKNLVAIGHNMMTGLLNGIIKGAKKVTRFIKDLANSILSTFKAVLGIHSPSTVMEAQGKFVVLGLANGINKNSSLVDKAMDALATSVIDSANKIIGNKVDFGLLDYNGEYKAWKKISKLFTRGSEQYQTAMEKMEDARKNVNLRIIQLQNDYNDTLDNTIEKISTMYGLFDEVDLSGGMNIGEITENLDQQVARLQEWSAAQEAISQLELDPKFIEELQAMGVDATNELAAIAGASADQISQLNTLWLKKQRIASKAATNQLSSLKKDTLSQISNLKDGIDGETVDVIEVGGRLVSNIGDGITGALPTLESSFAQLNGFIAKQVAESGDELADSVADSISAEDITKGLQTGLDDAFKGIEGSVKEMGKGMAGVIAAVIGAPIAWKALSKLGLKDKITKALSFGKKTKEIVDTSKTVQQITQVGQGLTQSAESLTKAGSQMTKAQSAMKTMRSGILNIIVLAGAIAAMGVALKIAYESIPNDIGGLVAKLGVIAGVITVMGGLAALGGKFDDSIKTGLKLIAIIAGEVALTAIAISVANSMIPDDLGNLIAKMATMGGVITGMGVLAGIAGAFDDTILSGLKLITIIAGEIALTGIAIGVANAMIPDDLGNLIGKLGIMGLAIAEFGVLAGIISAIPVDMKSGLVTMALIAGEIALTGLALGVADRAIQSDFNTFIGKLGIMGLAITEFGVLAGVIGALMSTGVGAVFLSAGLVALLGICGGIAATAIAIGEIDKQVPDNINGVKAKIGLMTEALQAMISANFGNIFENLGNAININLVAKVAEGFAKIAETLAQISSLEIDTETIKQKVAKIKECIEILADLQAGSFWKNLENAASTTVMTKTVENIHNIVTKLGECIVTLKTLEGLVGEGNTVEGYVNTVKRIVENLAQIQTGGFWKQLDNANAVEQINRSAGAIDSIISKVSEICAKLQNLDDNYGNGKAESLVTRAIGIMKQFEGVKLDDGTRGWFSSSVYEITAKNLESVQKTSDLISKIVESASNTFDIVQGFVKDKTDTNGLIAKAVEIMQAFAGVELADGGHGWFATNVYERVASDLENVKKVAGGIAEIVTSASNIAKTIQDFNSINGDLKSYVEKANEIMKSFAEIQIPQEWVEDTANKSGFLNTTAGNVGNILVAASTIIENIQKFNDQKINIPDLVKQANTILQELAKIELKQDHLENTSKNAGFLNTAATNIDSILGTASTIIDKMVNFDKIGVENVKNLVDEANQIIEKFGELNLNGNKNYEQLANNANSLSAAVTSVKDILDKAGATIDAVRNFTNNYNLAELQETITGKEGLNAVLKTIASIKIEGLGNGEEKVKQLDIVKQIIEKVREIAESMNSVPDAAEKLTNIEAIIKFIGEKLSTLPTALQEYSGDFIEVGSSYAQKFGEGWANQYDIAVKNGQTMAEKYAEGVRSTFPQFADAGAEMQGALWNAIEKKLQDEFWQGAALAGKVIDGLNSKICDFEGVGKNAVQGFINGANSQNPYSAGAQIAEKFLNGLKDRGRQGSPWKTTFQSGTWAVEGLIDGLAKSENALVQEATTLADEVIDALDMSDVTLTPTLDAEVSSMAREMPTMSFDDEYDPYYSQNRRPVTINQTNNNYTQYSLEQVNRDLAWELSKR